MKKLLRPAFVMLLALACLMLLDRSCNQDRAIRDAKRDYAELKRASESNDAVQQEAIRNAEEKIARQDAVISASAADIAKKNAAISALRSELAGIVGEEPSQPELESEPLVINLRKQITWLNSMLTLAQGVADEQDKQIRAWSAKFDAQVEISNAWKARYEGERALRIRSEELFKISEHGRKMSKFWKAVAIGGTVAGIAAGYVIAK